jgi:hypothetical protein
VASFGFRVLMIGNRLNKGNPVFMINIPQSNGSVTFSAILRSIKEKVPVSFFQLPRLLLTESYFRYLSGLVGAV